MASDPDEDEAEWREIQRELDREAAYERMHTPRRGQRYCPADFVYDPLARKGFE